MKVQLFLLLPILLNFVANASSVKNEEPQKVLISQGITSEKIFSEQISNKLGCLVTPCSYQICPPG